MTDITEFKFYEDTKYGWMSEEDKIRALFQDIDWLGCELDLEQAADIHFSANCPESDEIYDENKLMVDEVKDALTHCHSMMDLVRLIHHGLRKDGE